MSQLIVNRAFRGEITQFPAKGVHDDFVDAATMAHMRLTQPGPQLIFGRSQPSPPKPVKRFGGNFLKRHAKEDWDD
jgi:hypothetical protein